jgi:hypothetical protein
MMTNKERYAYEKSAAPRAWLVLDMLSAHSASVHTSAVCRAVQGLRTDCGDKGDSWATRDRAVLKARLDERKAQDTFRTIHREALRKYGQDIDENFEQTGPKFKLPEYEAEYAETVLSEAEGYYERARERTRQNDQREPIIKPRWRPCGVR